MRGFYSGQLINRIIFFLWISGPMSWGRGSGSVMSDEACNKDFTLLCLNRVEVCCIRDCCSVYFILYYVLARSTTKAEILAYLLFEIWPLN